MKKSLLLLSLLVSGGVSAQAQLIDVQFGGNDYGTVAVPQTGVGLIGSPGDLWNDYTSDSALESTVNVLNSAGTFTGTTLTVSAPSSIYQYADGVNPGNPYGANQLSANGSLVGNLASGELGNGTKLTLSLTGLTADTTFDVYLLSAPDRWERSSSWSVNGGTAQKVGPLNSYTGPYTNNGPGWAPYEPVLGINYLVLSGTTDALGDLTIQGTSVAGDVDINGFQLESITAAPEPSTYALMLGGLAMLVWLQTARRKSNA